MLVTDTTAGPFGPKQTPKEELKRAMFWEGGDEPIKEDDDEDYPFHSTTTN